MAIFYLDCPYAKKDEAKALGAKWDAGVKKWYATGPKEEIVEKFKEFYPEEFVSDAVLVSESYQNPGIEPVTDWGFYMPEHFCVLDTEDTGFSGRDEVIELGIIDEKGDELYHSRFCPTAPITPGASKVTGFTNDILENEPLFENEWENIKKAIGDRVIIAFNTKYDKRMMLQTAKRYKIPVNEVETLFENAMDALKILKEVTGKGSKLSVAAEAFGIVDEQKHLASYDCLMTLQVLIKLNEFLKEGKEFPKIA